MWDNLSWGKKILIAIPVVGAIFAWQAYDRSSEAKSTKAEMVQMCDGEQPCIAAVEQHSELCFKDNYKMGKRSGIRMDDFVKCINERSGTEFFTAVDK